MRRHDRRRLPDFHPGWPLVAGLVVGFAVLIAAEGLLGSGPGPTSTEFQTGTVQTTSTQQAVSPTASPFRATASLLAGSPVPPGKVTVTVERLSSQLLNLIVPVSDIGSAIGPYLFAGAHLSQAGPTFLLDQMLAPDSVTGEGTPYRVLFRSDATQLSIETYGSAAQFRLLVIGMAATGVEAGPPSDGALYAMSLGFEMPGLHDVELQASGNFDLGGVALPPGANIATAPPLGRRAIFLGDSYTEGLAPTRGSQATYRWPVPSSAGTHGRRAQAAQARCMSVPTGGHRWETGWRRTS